MPVANSLIVRLRPVVVDQFHVVGKLDLAEGFLQEVYFVLDVILDGLIRVNWLVRRFLAVHEFNFFKQLSCLELV